MEGKDKRIELTPSQSSRIVSTLASMSLSSEGVERCFDMLERREKESKGPKVFVGVEGRRARSSPKAQITSFQIQIEEPRYR